MARSILGAVLAGGRSRRMGRDKAALPVRGRPLVDGAVASLLPALDEVVVVVRDLERAPASPVPVIADRFVGQGPLAGVHAALEHARGRAVFVLACDLPNVGPELVAHLMRRARPASEARIWYASVGADRQPLCGVWTAGCRPEIEAALEAGRRGVRELVERLGGVAVELEPSLPFYRRDLLHNLNRLRDLETLAPA